MFYNDSPDICVFYALSPLHAGSGQATGAVDLPIQRERHTLWPQMQASGVKGAFRHWFHCYHRTNGAQSPDAKEQAKNLTARVFGSEEGQSDSADGSTNGQDSRAGAISVSDARLLAFPVRSNAAPFVWVTCPAVLTRLRRDLRLVALELEVPILSPGDDDGYLCVCGNIAAAVVLEDLAVSPESPVKDQDHLARIFRTLVPQVTRLLVISDRNYSFLSRTATEIQPQIKIDMETGTAADGSLRYEELLPADSVLYSLVFFGQERVLQDPLMTDVIRQHVTKAVSTHIQMGGDMTLGRGLMEVKWVHRQDLQGGDHE
ncbi:MAG: type III-B CRISPR module RAMP protein Cmr4 [Pseudomonadota bacterium]